jgi:hypothetical protein
MPLAHRRICGLYGRAFALVMPPDEEETERDKQTVSGVPEVAARAPGD